MFGMLGRFVLGGIGYDPPNAASRKLILSILNSTATKREAKDYITKYANGAKINHCLLLTRQSHRLNEKSLLQLSEVIKRLHMLGLRPICLIPPSSHVPHQAESLDKMLTRAQLRPLHCQNGLTKLLSGRYESILSSQSYLFSDERMTDVVPIIRPFVFEESSATQYMTKDAVTFTRYLCSDNIPYIDKFFILNRIGGIPSGERNENSHVFINLSQEFGNLREVLQRKYNELDDNRVDSDDVLGRLKVYAMEKKTSLTKRRFKEHIEDIQLMNAVLSKLSTTATGLITTVKAASLASDENNPLLYNLLTDRSLISSSLPRFKKRHGSLELTSETHSWYELPFDLEEENNYNSMAKDAVAVTTVLKKGVHIKIFNESTLTQYNCIGLPTKFHSPQGGSSLKLEKLNLNKLESILNQSFGRKIDLEHYLDRINGNVASVIVIGDYEGIAILTFEGPAENQFVYLDKFAVLPHLKGSLGISDIIFNLMFKMFPRELLWRSRRENVVNKWYFQRSVGVLDLSIKLANGDRRPSQFKLFFYGDPEATNNSFENQERLDDYAKYVRDINPSWKK